VAGNVGETINPVREARRKSLRILGSKVTDLNGIVSSERKGFFASPDGSERKTF
jgi:hypothetical protein